MTFIVNSYQDMPAEKLSSWPHIDYSADTFLIAFQRGLIKEGSTIVVRREDNPDEPEKHYLVTKDGLLLLDPKSKQPQLRILRPVHVLVPGDTSLRWELQDHKPLNELELSTRTVKDMAKDVQRDIQKKVKKEVWN